MGRAHLQIESEQGGILFANDYFVKTDDFQIATVGMGALAHQTLLCNIGRITYDRFNYQPSSGTGKVRISFSPGNGAALEGSTEVLFDQ